MKTRIWNSSRGLGGGFFSLFRVFLSAPKVFSSENARRGPERPEWSASPHRLRSCAAPHGVFSPECAYYGSSLSTDHDGSQTPRTSTPPNRHVHDTGNVQLNPARGHASLRSLYLGLDTPQRNRYREASCGRSVYEGSMDYLGARRTPSFSALRSTCLSTRLANGEMVCNSIQTTLCLLCSQFFPSCVSSESLSGGLLWIQRFFGGVPCSRYVYLIL
ncbi:hypothetical protein DFH09DRAFT_1135349 [Mycena vulgaris]|nr:hypothetical protein DFH09DRAFT_1135349 [Mycena vulgaris]